MADISLTLFDLGVLTVLGLSALLSFFRGFLREMISLAAWVGASIVTIRAMPSVSEYLKPHIGSPVIANGIAAIGLFFITLITISILCGLVMKLAKPGDKIGLIDNLVGFVFGIARGALIVAIGYFAMSLVLVEKDYPNAVREAYSQPYVAKLADWLSTFAPDYLEKITNEGDAPTLDRDSINRKADESAEKINDLSRKISSELADDAPSNEDLPASSVPSMKDLQQRIHDENERP